MFAENCEPRVGRPLFSLPSDGCRAKRCGVSLVRAHVLTSERVGQDVGGEGQPARSSRRVEEVTCGLRRAHWATVFVLTQYF